MSNKICVNMAGFAAIGQYKENLVTRVEFPAERLGDGTGAYTILFQRPGEEAPYPVACENEWPRLIWVVHAADTAIPGVGKAYLRWDGPNGEVGKSQIYTVQVNPGLADPTEAPEEWAGYMGQVAGFAEAAREQAKRSETAAAAAAETLLLVEGARDQAREARDRAEKSAENAEAARTAAEESAEAAAKSAELAGQAAADKGWLYVDGEEDGHLYLYTADNVDGLSLEDDNGRLVAIYE